MTTVRGPGRKTPVWSMTRDEESDQWLQLHRAERTPGSGSDSSRFTVEVQNQFTCLGSVEKEVDTENDDPEICEMKVIETKGKWTRITCTMDSGAADHVIPANMMPNVKPKKTGKERKFVTAGGDRIKDEGVKRLKFTTCEKIDRVIDFRAAKVMKPFISVAKVIKAGNEVVLNKDNPHIKNEKDGSIIKLRCQGDVFVLDVWVNTEEMGPVFARQGK